MDSLLGSIPPLPGSSRRIPSEWTAGLLYFIYLFVRIRWAAIVLALAAITAAQFALHAPYYYWGLYGVLAFLTCYNAYYHRFSRRRRKIETWPYLDDPRDRKKAKRAVITQINLDYLSLFCLLLFSDGALNPVVSLFFFHVVVSGILLERRIAILEAAVPSLMVFILTGLRHVLHVDFAGQLGVGRGELWTTGVFPPYAAPAILSLAFFALGLLTNGIVARYAQRLKQSVIDSNENREKSERLEALAETRRKLLAIASHDMKSPLATVASYLMAMNSGYLGGISDKQRPVIEKCLAKINSLTAFVHDVLSLQAIDRGEVLHRLEKVNPLDPVNRAVDNLLEMAQQKGVSIEVHGFDSVPEIEADPRRLYQVFENVLSNAVKYSAEGGAVHFHALLLNGRVRFSVEDSGIGMSEEDLSHLFEEFFRSKRVRVKYEGTGMGMAIVKRTVEVFGGDVWAESEEGKGTKIHIELPVVQIVDSEKSVNQN